MPLSDRGSLATRALAPALNTVRVGNNSASPEAGGRRFRKTGPEEFGFYLGGPEELAPV